MSDNEPKLVPSSCSCNHNPVFVEYLGIYFSPFSHCEAPSPDEPCRCCSTCAGWQSTIFICRRGSSHANMGPEQFLVVVLLWRQRDPVANTAASRIQCIPHLDLGVRAPQTTLWWRVRKWQIMQLCVMGCHTSSGVWVAAAVWASIHMVKLFFWPWHVPPFGLLALASQHGQRAASERRQLLPWASSLSFSHLSSAPSLCKHTVLPRARGTEGQFSFLPNSLFFFPPHPHPPAPQTHYRRSSLGREGTGVGGVLWRWLPQHKKTERWEKKSERKEDNALIPPTPPWQNITPAVPHLPWQ